MNYVIATYTEKEPENSYIAMYKSDDIRLPVSFKNKGLGRYNKIQDDKETIIATGKFEKDINKRNPGRIGIFYGNNCKNYYVYNDYSVKEINHA